MTPEQKAHEAAMIAEYQRERDRHSQTAAACLAAEAALDEARRERDDARDALARARSAVEAAEVAAGAAREEAQALRAQWQSSLVSLRTGTLERERDAALAREARLREAAGAVLLYGSDEGLTTRDYHPIEPDSGPFATLRRILAASPAEHGERVIAKAEERGAGWQRVGDARSIMESAARHPGGRVGDVGDPTHPLALATRDCRELPFPAEVCRAARKEGT